MNLSVSYSEGVLNLYLSGELDHHEAGKTVSAVEALLDEYLPRCCVLDLAGLRFMDSSGIAVVIRIGKKMKSLGGDIRLENPPGQVRRVLDASGIGRLVAAGERS